MNGSALLTQPPPWIVGHRGAAADAVENTLESLELAVRQGADMVEVDLQLTADGRLVAFHDPTLERLASSGAVVESSPYDHLLERYPALATLPEVLEALPPEVPLNLELKRREADPHRLVERLVEQPADRLTRDLRRRRALVSSFDWSLLHLVRERQPELPVAPIGRQSAGELLRVADRLQAWSVHCHRLLADEVMAAAPESRRVLAFTVNEASEARRLVDLGVSGLFTDAPGRLRRELQE